MNPYWMTDLMRILLLAAAFPLFLAPEPRGADPRLKQ